ncbi:OmpA family protein [Pseudooceanicola sp. CBS1P-1]|uniref:OmpA family protein n=1 Tax=Pseudooceanicola albus TaxID=2692189 RepID=A0A6L7G0W0_9RHOB|nr:MULTISPECIES: OmpA family protein [Pseudooceanicola]MBT9382476.1 OmpA family protein [Pseudooceanicola endophyticus]MXN17017.1 OmpA family protein [Pseudooceanicola albus]
MTKTLLKSSTALVMSIALALPSTGFSQSNDGGKEAQTPRQEAPDCAPSQDCKAPGQKKHDGPQAGDRNGGEKAADHGPKEDARPGKEAGGKDQPRAEKADGAKAGKGKSDDGKAGNARTEKAPQDAAPGKGAERTAPEQAAPQSLKKGGNAVVSEEKSGGKSQAMEAQDGAKGKAEAAPQKKKAEAPKPAEAKPEAGTAPGAKDGADKAPNAKADAAPKAAGGPDADELKRRLGDKAQDTKAEAPKAEGMKAEGKGDIKAPAMDRKADAPAPKAEQKAQSKPDEPKEAPDTKELERRLGQKDGAPAAPSETRSADAPKRGDEAPRRGEDAVARDDARRPADAQQADRQRDDTRRPEGDAPRQTAEGDAPRKIAPEELKKETAAAEDPGVKRDPRQMAEDQAKREANRQDRRREVAAAGKDAKVADVREDKVSKDEARSSDEEFRTRAGGDAPQARDRKKDDGNDFFDTIAKAAVAGIGAYAVGSLLNNGDKVVSNSGDRVVVLNDGQYRVLKDDNVLLRQPGNDLRTETFSDGSTRTTVTRPDGARIETIRAADGTVLQRTRLLENGDRVVLFDDTQSYRQVNVADLPQHRDQVIQYQGTDSAALERALRNEQVKVGRTFSLGQIRDISAVRKLVPEVSLNDVTFATGSAVIQPEEAQHLATLGKAMADMIATNPGEVFLVEGHTDAVGNAGSNLALSDRRAESLALALSEYFDVPPENMVVQGYGESDLKVQTASADRDNRRAAVRRITPLLQQGN